MVASLGPRVIGPEVLPYSEFEVPARDRGFFLIEGDK